MKKSLIIILISLLIMSTFCYSQSFPGKNPNLLVNKTVIAKEKTGNPSLRDYKNFYSEYDKKKNEISFSAKHLLQEKHNLGTPYDKLVGKEFLVTEVLSLKRNFSSSPDEYALVLQNDEFGTVYYKYNSSMPVLFELEVIGGIQYPEGMFCDEIEKVVDKFDGKITYRTPMEQGIQFIKVLSKGKETVYLSVRNSGSTANVGKTGLTVLFEDGTKFERPLAKIDVDVNRSNFVYSSFEPISKSELKIFSEKIIADTRLYVYDASVNKDVASIIKEYVKCIIDI